MIFEQELANKLEEEFGEFDSQAEKKKFIKQMRQFFMDKLVDAMEKGERLQVGNTLTLSARKRKYFDPVHKTKGDTFVVVARLAPAGKKFFKQYI